MVSGETQEFSRPGKLNEIGYGLCHLNAPQVFTLRHIAPVVKQIVSYCRAIKEEARRSYQGYRSSGKRRASRMISTRYSSDLVKARTTR